MGYFESLMEEDNTARDNVRSAVVLGKVRFDEQLGPFVRTSKVRLESSLVQSELNRIIAEVANESRADPERVGAALRTILSDAVAVTEPEKTTLDSDKTFGAPAEGTSVPSGGDTKEESPLPGVERTDVNDSDAVCEEALDADATIDITKPLNSESKVACVRCKEADALENSPVCQVCSDALVALAKKKEALAPNNSAPMQAQQHAAPTGAPTHLMPLNPNAPYQCTVCGRTGTWDEVNNHLQTALDVPHMTAKQQLQLQDQQGLTPQQPGMPQHTPAYHASFIEQDELVKSAGMAPEQVAEMLKADLTGEAMERWFASLMSEQEGPSSDVNKGAKTAGEYEKQQDENAAVDDEHAQTPSSHFDYVIENMANRAAARHFSAPTDEDISQIASTYGLDANEIKQSIQATATFGNYHASNGVIGPGSGEGPPEGYTEVDLNNNGNGIQAHEAVVPMNLAIRKVSEDLNMDPNSVYDSVKGAYGGDLSDEYHTSVQGEFHYYLPQELMAKATSHPQPQAPDQSQQSQQPMQAQPNMNMPQPDQNQMPQMASSVLNDEQLEVLLTRDGKLADQRARVKEAFNPPPGSTEDLERMHKFNPANKDLSQPNEIPSGQACPYCNGPMSVREAQNGLCDNCNGQTGLPSNSLTGETVSPSYI